MRLLPFLLLIPACLFAQQNEKASGFSLGAELLYMQCHEEGLAFGILNSEAPPPAVFTNAITHVITNGKLLNTKPKWTAGLRLVSGYTREDDGIDLLLSYTKLLPGSSSSFVQSTSHLILPSLITPAFLGSDTEPAPFSGLNADSLEFAKTASSKWHLSLQLIDAEMGKRYPPAILPLFTVRPHLGARYSAISQNQQVTYLHPFDPANLNLTTNDITEIIIKRQDYKGIGIRAGTDIEYFFGHFGFYGKASTTLSCSHFNLKNSDQISSAALAVGSYKSELRNSFYTTKVAGELDLGVIFQKSLKKTDSFINFTLGWKQMLFFNHNQMLHPVDNNGSGIIRSNHGDLSLYGFKASATLNF